MNVSRNLVLLASCLLFVPVPCTWASFLDFLDDAATSDELATSYPTISSTQPSNRAGNPKILCPFLRLLERSGRLDADGDDLVIANRDLKPATSEFGCDTSTACGPVIDAVSAGQTVTAGVDEFTNGGGLGGLLNDWFGFGGGSSTRPSVDLERLWDAPPISHACGLTFETPGEIVSNTRLATTLADLRAKSNNNNGQLVYQDLLDVKLGICQDEQVDISSAGRVETKLIFAFLGGVDRGYIEYSDVERFLAVNNTLPITKASKPISAFYLLQVN